MKNKFIKILTTLLTILLIISPFTQVKADAGRRYIVAVLFNESGSKLDFAIYEHDYSGLWEKFLTNYTENRTAKLTSTNEGFKDAGFTTHNMMHSGGGHNGGLYPNEETYLVFPGYPIGSEPTPTNKDFNQAEEVIGRLVTDLNTAISFVETHGTNSEGVQLKEAGESVSNIANYIASKVYGGSSNITVNNIQISSNISSNEIKELGNNSGTYLQGIRTTDYIRITDSSTNESNIYMHSCPKGYSSGQRFDNTAFGNNASSYPVDRISWAGLISYAQGARDEGIMADNNGFESFFRVGAFEQDLSEFSGSLSNLGARILGFSSIEEMVFSRNSRQYSYYLGMMPYTWFQISNALFWVFEIVAVLILLASILNTVFKSNYAVISPKERLSIQDQIADTLIAIFLMVMYVPFFYILAKSNSMLVNLFDSMTGGRTLVSWGSGHWLVRLIFTITNLFIIIKINITYLVRAATITLLHVISPAAIASMSFTGKGRGSLFNTWLKEMIGAIFMQTFDAILLALFILITTSGTSQNMWESELLLYMFIPLNNWFKQTVTGTGGIGQVAGQASGAIDEARKDIHSRLKGAGDIAQGAMLLSDQKKDAQVSNGSTSGGSGGGSSITSGMKKSSPAGKESISSGGGRGGIATTGGLPNGGGAGESVPSSVNAGNAGGLSVEAATSGTEGKAQFGAGTAAKLISKQAKENAAKQKRTTAWRGSGRMMAGGALQMLGGPIAGRTIGSAMASRGNWYGRSHNPYQVGDKLSMNEQALVDSYNDVSADLNNYDQLYDSFTDINKEEMTFNNFKDAELSLANDYCSYMEATGKDIYGNDISSEVLNNHEALQETAKDYANNIYQKAFDGINSKELTEKDYWRVSKIMSKEANKMHKNTEKIKTAQKIFGNNTAPIDINKGVVTLRSKDDFQKTLNPDKVKQYEKAKDLLDAGNEALKQDDNRN